MVETVPGVAVEVEAVATAADIEVDLAATEQNIVVPPCFAWEVQL